MKTTTKEGVKMIEFKESKFYKLLQDFSLNNDKETFLQLLAEFYNRTEGIIIKNDTQDELIKELREMYIKFNEEGIDDNIVREKVNYFIENSEKIQNIIAKLISNTNNIKNINTQLDNIKNKQNDVLINVRDFGVLGNGTDETEKIQLAFDSIEKGQTLYFPIGDYRTRGIIFKNGDGYDIVKIKGASSKQFTEDGLEDNPRENCTSITYIGDNNGFLFDKLTTCTNRRRVIIDNILFKGSVTINDPRYQQNSFIYHGRNESVNGAYANVYATNCKFWGFKTVVGEYQEYDNGQDGDLRTDIEQTNIYATRCQFTRNKHALSNIIDSYVNKCVFNLNDVAIILRKWGFANRIIDNRIEWNREYGIYLYQGWSLRENKEFDRNGYAGL